jgi:hypothetical protein
MSRIINTAGSPQTQRNRLRRTIAEALNLLMRKSDFDTESKDLTAIIVLSLRGIDESVEQTTEAWEKRDYYMKAEEFRREWAWVAPMERMIRTALLEGQVASLPPLFVQLIGRFQDITITKQTRDSSVWDGAFEKLKTESRTQKA